MHWCGSVGQPNIETLPPITCTHFRWLPGVPTFVRNPENTIAIVDDVITLTCLAEATPISPFITWMSGNGEPIVDDDVFNISTYLSVESVNSNVSALSFTATSNNQTGNGSTFRCVATVLVELIDRNLTNESEIATLTIAGVWVGQLAHTCKMAVDCIV